MQGRRDMASRWWYGGEQETECRETMAMKRSVRCGVAVVVCVIMSLSVAMAGVCASSDGWVERRPAGDVGRDWYGLASDSTGTHLIAAAFGNWGTEGWVYTSTDGGTHWTIRYPSPNSQYWRAAASSSDGSHLVVVTWSGLAYTSSDGGVNWTRVYPTGQNLQRLQTVASSADGSHLIVGASVGRVFTSSNGGVDWTERRPAGNIDGDWRGASSNADGSVLFIGNYDGRLYRTANGGVTWTELTPAGTGNHYWQGTACDGSGNHIIVGVEGGGLYTSSNGGSSWTERRPAGDTDRNWSRFSSDADGRVLLAADEARLYLSQDSGVVWTEQRPAGDKDVRWTCCSSADGSRLLVGGYAGGRLYTLDTAAVTRALAVTRVGSGTVTLDPSGGTYDDGTVVTVTGTPATGYAFSGWSGDLSGMANPARITMDGNKAITATFEKETSQSVVVVRIGRFAFTVNGASKTLDSPPVIKNGRTLIPIRAIIEALGGTVGWDGTARKATVTLGRVTIELWIGQGTARVNNISTRIDSTNLKVVPEIINGRTMLPLRFVTENLGATVGWEQSTQTITITYAP